MRLNKYRGYSDISICTAILICLGFLLPLSLHAQEDAKFQVELFGGVALFNLTHLNQIVSYDTNFQEFMYDWYFDYLELNGALPTWFRETKGERKQIKDSIPVGGRVRYTILDYLDISIGFQYFQKSNSEDLLFTYVRNFYYEQHVEILDYSPYSLDVKAYLPTIGVHVHKQVFPFLEIEGFVTGGPIFAEFGYTSDSHYSWTIQGIGYEYLAYETDRLLEMSGSGSGISIEVGGRFSFPVYRKFSVFFEGGYAYQVVKSPSGTGREVIDGREKTWDGKWVIKTETISTPWGTQDFQSPTNYPVEGDGIEEFKLDFSGFRVLLGFSVRF